MENIHLTLRKLKAYKIMDDVAVFLVEKMNEV